MYPFFTEMRTPHLNTISHVSRTLGYVGKLSIRIKDAASFIDSVLKYSVTFSFRSVFGTLVLCHGPINKSINMQGLLNKSMSGLLPITVLSRLL